MPATPESRDYGLLERLADEFADRHRRGERPTVEEYAEKYPALADDLRELLPAMVELEKAQRVMAPEAPTPPPGGDRLFGDFRVLREIGRGGMGGRQLTDQLEVLRPRTRVPYLSGYTDDAVVRHGVLRAEAAFLQKPFSPTALALKVREVLDQ